MGAGAHGSTLPDFFASVRAAGRRALLLDYDGTLAPFRVERDQAVPYPGVREALRAIIEARGTRVVVISGRAARELPPLLGLERPPEIWGTHGWERLMPDGTYEVASLAPEATSGLDAAWAGIVSRGWTEHAERKPASLALHWRGLPSDVAQAMRAETGTSWPQLAQGGGLVATPFDGGVELRAPGHNKGIAVATLLAELGAGTAVAYLGDDLTDEDAFQALKGKGLGALVRSEWRETAADVWLRPPDELLAFLWQWHAAAQS